MQPNPQFWEMKNKEEIHELMYLHPYAFLIFADLCRFCYDSGYPHPVLTNVQRTQEEEAAAGAESTSHLTRRAFDLRSTIWTKDQITNITNYLTLTWGTKYGAKNSQGQIRLVVYHKVTGNQWHLHCQISIMFALPEWKGIPNA